jgi:integrase
MTRPPRKGARTGRPKAPDTRQGSLELQEPGQPTVEQVVTWFLREHVDGPELGLSTKRGYRSTLRHYLKCFGPEARPTKGETRQWLEHRWRAREVSALTANSHRDRLHHVYCQYRDERNGLTLNPFTWRRFKEDTRHLKGAFSNLGEVWPKLLKAMPDDRARAFLSLMLRRGFRLGELLGLEWRHVRHLRAEKGAQPEVVLEQQRRAWEDVPGELKHDGLRGTYALHPETVQLLQRAQRALREGKSLMGCQRGSLVGQRPCKDSQPGGEVFRQFVFPYREEHLGEILTRLRAAAPAEFPPARRGLGGGEAFHRFRRHFGTMAVTSAGAESIGKAKKWLRHKYLTSTQLYASNVLGVQASAEELAELDAAMDNTLSASVQESDNVLGSAGQ